jgi:hypothetical protein
MGPLIPASEDRAIATRQHLASIEEQRRQERVSRLATVHATRCFRRATIRDLDRGYMAIGHAVTILVPADLSEHPSPAAMDVAKRGR